MIPDFEALIGVPDNVADRSFARPAGDSATAAVSPYLLASVDVAVIVKDFAAVSDDVTVTMIFWVYELPAFALGRVVGVNLGAYDAANADVPSARMTPSMTASPKIRFFIWINLLVLFPVEYSSGKMINESAKIFREHMIVFCL